MEHPIIHFVSDSSEEEDPGGQSAEEQPVPEDASRAPDELEPTRLDQEPAPAFADRRRAFLHGTASQLMVSRVDSVCQLQGIVKDLGETMGDMRSALEQAGDLHARLARLLTQEKRDADMVVEKHSFSRPAAEVPPFSSVLANVADMFMVDMSDDQ